MARKKGPKGEAKGAWADAAAASAAAEANGSQAKIPTPEGVRDIAESREEVELPTAKLSDGEVAIIAAEAANLQGQIDELEGEQASKREEYRAAAKVLKTRLADVQKAHRDKSREVRERVRMVMTSIRIERDYTAGQVRRYRLDRGHPDIGELYDTEAMDPREREQALFAPPEGERLDVEEGGDDAEA